jgi:hypothetical protein
MAKAVTQHRSVVPSLRPDSEAPTSSLLLESSQLILKSSTLGPEEKEAILDNLLKATDEVFRMELLLKDKELSYIKLENELSSKDEELSKMADKIGSLRAQRDFAEGKLTPLHIMETYEKEIMGFDPNER